jgi:beta-lactamase regulating signal transducer with metallopeptidase domain
MNFAIATNSEDALVWALSVCILTTSTLALMLMASRRLFQNAALRHLGWATAFVLILFLPLFQSLLPHALEYRLQLSRQSRGDRLSRIDRPAANFAASATPSGRALVVILGTIWASGVGVIAFRCAAAAVQLRRMRMQSTPFPLDGQDTAGLREEVGGWRRWHLRVSTTADPASPLTWGFFRPVVLLPRDSVRWERARLRAALLHELAHVRRGDNLFQVLALAVCALHWFNPLVWVCARRMQTEAEIAADDFVLCAGVRPSSYAAELLQFALRLNGRHKSFALLGASMATPLTLETRITSIVNPDPVRGRPRSIHALGMLALCLSTVCCLCFLRPSLAGERPPSRTDTPGLSQNGVDVSRPSARARATPSGDSDEVPPAMSERQSPDVLSEPELRELRRRRNAHSRYPSSDVVGEAPAYPADSRKHPDRLGADRLPQ